MEKQSLYPKGFLWGAATAAHQVEGGNYNQWSEWERAHAEELARDFRRNAWFIPDLDRFAALGEDPDNYISGRSTDHYHRYEEDFRICRELGLNAFRFSIEWSRLEPEPGSWDEAEARHYKEYLAAMAACGLEPVMTLFHFTVPVWFDEKGGFLKRQNVKYFLRFAEKAMEEFGEDVTYVILINEPEIYAWGSYATGQWPPGHHSKRQCLAVLNNLIHAFNVVAPRLHGAYPHLKLSIATNSTHYYPGNKSLLTKLAVRFRRLANDDYFLRRIRKNCDFVGVNYYFSSRLFGFKPSNENKDLSDLGWDMRPRDIGHALERLWEKHGLPLLVTENGLADRDDKSRPWWLAETFAGLEDALGHHVPVLGYLHWSLLDNFEWAQGRWPCFGLVEIDYGNGLQRTVRPSAYAYADYIKRQRQPAQDG